MQVSTYVQAKSKINRILKYQRYIRNHGFPRTPLPPLTAIQNHHDEHPTSKSCATKTNNSNTPNENISLVTKVTASNSTKNNPQRQNSDPVTLKNMENDNVNINTDLDKSTGNDKNPVHIRRIKHATTATVTNNRFTTKCTLDIRPEKPNSVINSSKIHRKSLKP